LAALQEHIELIHTKLQQLLKQYDHLQKQHARQQETISALEKEKEDMRIKLEALQQQNLLLRSAAAPLEGADKKEMEKKIDQYIRHIDKCIAMLSQ